MALVVPTATPWLQNSGANNSAQLLRLAVAGLAKGNVSGPATIGPRSGVAPQSFIATQNGGGNMSVNVSAGLGLVNGTEAFAQGGYWVINDASVNLTVTASSSSANRIDSVYLAIQDDFYSGATHTAVMAVAAGNPATPTTPPTLPANSLELWRITVRQNTTSILSTDLVSVRPWLSALGGIWQASSGELALNGLSDYDFRWDSTNGKLDRWDTTTSTWQNIMQYGNTSHVWHKTAFAVPGTNVNTTINGYTNDRSAGIATMTSGQNLFLNRQGKWAINLRAYSQSASAVDAVTGVWMEWTSGPWLNPLEDNRPRTSGFSSSGTSRVHLCWTGYVTAAQAAQAIISRAREQPASGTTSVNYDFTWYAEYLGG